MSYFALIACQVPGKIAACNAMRKCPHQKYPIISRCTGFDQNLFMKL
jgi:hypothetical protein